MSSQLEFDLYNIFAVFIKLVQPLLFKNGPGKQITVISVLFYSSVLENCQISNWLVGGFTCICHINSILDINVFLPGFALVIHLFSVTPAMLHRYTRSFPVQHFFNLNLKGNTTEFCSCPISYRIFRIALRHWGYLPIGEMGKFCWEGNFFVVVGIWGGVILTTQNFFRVKKQHLVKIPSVGVNVNFCRDNFFIGWWKFEEEWF